MPPRPQPSFRATQRGFILFAVLVFILLLSMITLSLLFRSQGDEAAGHATSGSEQAWSAAMSGIEEAMRVAATTPVGSSDWLDDSSLFRARAVYQDGADQWFFTVFSPADGDSLVETRYGLSDEASRLNLNHLGNADLSKIPGLNATLVSALGQFIGQGSQSAATPDGGASDDETLPAPVPAPSGAGTALSVTNQPSHGPLATLDELLLAPGFTRALLHGAPSSLDELSAPLTNSEGPQFPAEFSKPKRSRGLDQYFTVFSRDPNRSNAGQPRCNLNDEGDPLPTCDLPASFSNYVAAARTAKMRFGHPCEALEATVKVADERGVEVEVASGITKENLPALLDLFAADKEDGHDGLINVNTASSTVLATLPGIDLPLAESIVSTRAGLSADHRATVAWLYQEGLMDAAKFKAVAPYLTARSAQFRFNVIGYGMPSGRYRVLEVVADLSGTDPRVIYLRDITRLGLPISLKEENPAKPDGAGSPSQAAGLNPPHHPHG